MSNSLAQRPKFSVAIRSDAYKNLINNTLQDPKRASRFIAAVSSAVGATPALQECEAGSIITAALLGESLNLAPSPQLGQFYMVPFKQKEKRDRNGKVISPEMMKAQFILGYKGYIQLAIRSGQYKKINVLEVKDGELVSFDPFTEEIQCRYIEDTDERDAAPTIGYYAMFEYQNGFRKALYWSRKKMMAHADKYSPAFSSLSYEKLQKGKIPEKDLWKYSSFWYKDFDDMAKKTMLRQLISRWGVMSIEMQQAFEADNSLVERQDGEFVSTPAVETPAIEAPQIIPAEPEAEGVGEPMSLDDFEE